MAFMNLLVAPTTLGPAITVQFRDPCSPPFPGLYFRGPELMLERASSDCANSSFANAIV